MSADDEKPSLLDFARGTRTQQPAKPALVSDISDYRAAIEWLPGEHARRLSGSILIPHPTDNQYDPTEEIISYNQFMSAHRDATPGYLCLNFTIGSFEVFGKNMRALMMMFHPPGSVKELVIFNPDIHKIPEPDAPIIESIRYVSRAKATHDG